ncbi:hypothetical protein VAEKB19_3520032 [Vibrio aestuarianus]|nr:hypothetical protein VAEKB19_3520032 [Vibrio aestuarianus]
MHAVCLYSILRDWFDQVIFVVFISKKDRFNYSFCFNLLI